MVELEAVEEKRDRVVANLKAYQNRITRAYGERVVPRQLQEGDLVLKATARTMRGAVAPKFSPKWEGPFLVQDVSESGYCRLFDPNTKVNMGPFNMKWLKQYFASADDDPPRFSFALVSTQCYSSPPECLVILSSALYSPEARIMAKIYLYIYSATPLKEEGATV
uniref:Uncharacterized protein n=1 Tax=Davidia involucrata TaxID=16924 RepID=A0A5B7BEF8_DAVIN